MRTRTNYFFANCLVASAISLTGCGGAVAFGDTFPDNREDHLALVTQRLEAGREAALRAHHEQPILVAVSSAPMRLIAHDLEQGTQLWETPVELRTVPYVAGHSVVTHEGNEVVIRSLTTGRVTGRVGDRSLNLVGAAGEGDRGVIVLSTGGGVSAFSVVVGLSGGAPTFQAEMQQPLGAPAVAAGMGFVPWGHQNISVVDLGSGSEVARLRATQGVVASAVAEGGNIFFGQEGAALLNTNVAPTFISIPGEMPGDPALLRDAYQPPPGPNSAQSRVRLVTRLTAREGAAAFEGDAAYLVYYRLVIALNADGQSARWIAQLPRDAVGADVIDGGLLVTDESGAVHLLSTTDGRESRAVQLGSGVIYASSQADALSPGTPSGEVLPLRDQLLSAAQNTDARLVPLRELAVRLLAALPEAEVTGNLIAVCEEPATTASVRAEACRVLALRSTGNADLLHALERHASFLRGIHAPPVGALAQAALVMNEHRAVPLLLAHLRDSETASADIAPLARVLGAFGEASAAEPLADFIRLYRAETIDAGLNEGLLASLTAYRTLLGPTSREFLEETSTDALTPTAIRDGARAEIAALEAPTQAAPTASEATAESPDMTFTEADDPRPETLTPALVNQILSDTRPQLEACLRTPRRVVDMVRVVMVVEPQGNVLMVTTTPTEAQACIEPIVRAHSYPATRARGRQRVTVEVRR